jgi:hypothetical protein
MKNLNYFPIFLAVIAVSLVFPTGLRVQTPELDNPSKELEKLYIADQNDSRPNGTPEEAQATEARAKKRREQVSIILAKGAVQSAEDYFRAALGNSRTRPRVTTTCPLVTDTCVPERY